MDCELCRNKGYVTRILERKYIVDVPCDCLKIRTVYFNLERCGINKAKLLEYSFKNYLHDEEPYNRIYNGALEYVDNYENNWFFICGQSGSGKSHICTAIFQKIIRKGVNCRYMLWREEIPKIISTQNSYNSEAQLKYEAIITELTSIDFLYIDDLFKATGRKYHDDALQLAFIILDARYRNKKATMISTETTYQELSTLDQALLGRIYQMANRGTYFFDIPRGSKNFRMEQPYAY